MSLAGWRDHNIIDEATLRLAVAQLASHAHDGIGECFVVLLLGHAAGIRHGDVLHLHAEGGKLLSHKATNSARRRRAALRGVRERLVNRRRQAPHRWGEVAVPGRSRKAVRLPRCRCDDHRYSEVQVQVLQEPGNDCTLHRVLLAENNDVWLADVEKFQADSSHAAEEVRPAGSLAQPLHEARQYGSHTLDASGIHLFRRRREDRIHAAIKQKLNVPLQCPWVAIQILVWRELRGIDEDGHDDLVGLALCLVYELQVPLMQVAHRRHQGHALH
mmetsp:Transcript_51054/g.110792  ORF Transcript_51054/g.110792 Transcript_51054/m.110792 type:complete len:273 (+) Transcript_51054:118-936(+)|eukprot:CAMPEP_0170610178 /NCGR_PEP_ID=MMETSP0224-20130122/22515_1 /TAXON_ID=285029 /ORGANISM="Togula jolla, Strain CCCM 725" /LENGTH=272 /DNA_ID=CAMNT_0010935525 /DNA_START=49 /DNA_END=867 /DNA_ORIENTATION=-